MSQLPFPMITAEPPFLPGPPLHPPTPDPYAISQAKSVYLQARQFLKACQRCDQKGLICAEPISPQGSQARCEACRWAHSKCKVEIDGNLVRMGRNKWLTDLNKWVYVDQSRRHIGEWLFYYVEDSPSLTDVDDNSIALKYISCEWEEDVGPWLAEVKKVEAFEPWEVHESSVHDLLEGSEIPDEQETKASPLQKRSQSASTEDGRIHKRPLRPSSGGKAWWNPIVNSDSED